MKNALKFDFSNIKRDFFGGLTAGIVALPLALAFGGQTELGAITGLFLLTILLGLGELVGNIPNAVLAGILITVGIGIIDHKGFRHLYTANRCSHHDLSDVVNRLRWTIGSSCHRHGTSHLTLYEIDRRGRYFRRISRLRTVV